MKDDYDDDHPPLVGTGASLSLSRMGQLSRHGTIDRSLNNRFREIGIRQKVADLVQERRGAKILMGPHRTSRQLRFQVFQLLLA